MFHPNEKIGPYILIKFLGRGSFGEVWLGEKRTKYATTRFALKFPDTSKADLDAIRKEAAMWVKASGHPNVLPIIEADEYDGHIVIVSELALDGSLFDWLERHSGKAPSIDAAVKMMDGILAGLEHLHSRPILHRDLKPDNILLQGDTPRLADFGLARVLNIPSTPNIAGTPLYMSPEAYKNMRTEQVDLWAAAVIFYQLLSGNVPFAGDDMHSRMFAIMNEKAKSLPDEIPKPLRDFVATALKKNLNERFPTANAMRQAIQKAIQQEPTRIFLPPEPILIPQPQSKPLPIPPAPEPKTQPQPKPNPDLSVVSRPQPKAARRVQYAIAGIVAILLAIGIGVWRIKQASSEPGVEAVTQTSSNPDTPTKETKDDVALQYTLRQKQKEMDGLCDLLPNQVEISRVFENIKDLIKSQKLELKKFTPDKIVPSEIYTAQPIKIETTGYYDNIGLFLSQLGFYKRIVNVTDLDIKQAEDNAQYAGRSVNGSFVLTVFYLSPKNLVNLTSKPASVEDGLKQLEGRIKLIKQLRAEQKGPVAFLSAINERMPGGQADFKLTSVTQKGTKVQITGMSANQQVVADFARQLEFSNGLFTNVLPSIEGQEVKLEDPDKKNEDDATIRLFKFTIDCDYNKPLAEAPD